MKAGSLPIVACSILVSPCLPAADLNERLSVGGVAAAALCEQTEPGDDGCLGFPLQPELSFRPDDRNELFVKLGFAAGRTLDTRVPPWAADLEPDVERINGRETDHLLTAWYKHTATFGGGGTLGVTVGLIDATDYLDDNIYANDEFAQFMNVALVNAPNVFLPSYDKGVALDWRESHWSLRAVYMNVTENDQGRDFDFYGAQLGLHVDTPIGPGNYRLIVDGTDRQFADPSGRFRESCSAVTLSFDQQLAGELGAFLRLGRQDDSAAIDHRAVYSAGIQLGGSRWRRPADTIGLGWARLDGGNGDLTRSLVAEAYYRLVLEGILAVSGDVQYLADDLDDGSGTSRYVFGLRIAVEL